MKQKVVSRLKGACTHFMCVFFFTATLVAHDKIDQSAAGEHGCDESLPILVRGDISPSNVAYTISRSGVYKLTSAKTASGVTNISITASNVVLDLGGNTISGGTIGIFIDSVSNVIIKNGTIKGMTDKGIYSQFSTNCRIENCTIASCPIGIEFSGFSGFAITRCRVQDITQTGVSLLNCQNSYINDTLISHVYGSGSVYGISMAGGSATIVTGCEIRDIQTSSSTGTDKVVGVVGENENNLSLSGNSIQAVESVTTVSAYGVWVNGGDNASVTNNSVSQVTTSNGLGQGIFINQTNSYIASNLCFDCDFSFAGVSQEFITSQANARGVDNVDAKLTTPDAVEEIADQVSLLESTLDVCCYTLNSTIDLLLNDMVSIESILDVIDDKVDLLGSSIGDAILEASVIESLVDSCCFTSNSKLDLLLNDMVSIESTLDVIDDKVDLLGSSIGDAILEASVIESLIDSCCFTSNSKLDSLLDDTFTIESNIDLLIDTSACNATPLTPADISSQAIVLNSAGNYCMAQDLTATVSLVADRVSLCLNDRVLFGRVEVYGDYAVVKNGTVMLGGIGTEPVVDIISGADNCTLSNLTVVALTADSGAGRDALRIAGSNTVVEGGSFKGGSAVSGVGGHGIVCASSCVGAALTGVSVIGTGNGVGARAGNGIELESGSSSSVISDCRIAHTGTGSTNGIALNDQHAASSVNFSSIIHNNFAYDIANTSTVYEIRNLGAGGVSQGVSVIVGTPGLYDNVYVQ